MITDVGVPTPPREASQYSARSGDAPTIDWRTRALIRLGYWLLRVLGMTWRFRVHGRAAMFARQPGDPRVVLTMWHGQLLLIAWAQRQPSRALISEHRDGEIIARIVGWLGIGSIRGSSSRGGARALMESARVLQDGADVIVTPDGPRGPRHTFAPGALIVAQRARASIVPIGCYIDRAWRLRSWDQFEIPKPFARVTMLYGDPIPVHDADARAASARTEEMTAVMQATIARAELLARGAQR
jgi:lysophospholipid acyltransferase (LPLAT)-like uncharacterized protein